MRAQAAPDPPAPPAPVVVRGPQPAPLDPASAQMKPLPGRGPSAAAKPKGAPLQLASDANHKASAAPGQSDYFNAIVQYSYEPGTLYQVYAQPMRITDIALEPGEKILGEPASGDVVRWMLALGKSMQSGEEQWHVYLKPTRPELETNLAINTDRRSYLLELHSYDDTYMAAIVWHYPEDELARLQAQASELAGQQKNSVPVVGDRRPQLRLHDPGRQRSPAWTPVQVFDDGRRTFVRFPSAMVLREAPALFVLRDAETQLVNYRVKNDTYVIDRLIDAAELRVGQKDQEIVRITRSTGGRPPATGAHGEGMTTATPDRRASQRSTRTRPSSLPTTRACASGARGAAPCVRVPSRSWSASLLGAGVLAIALAFHPPRQDPGRCGAQRRARRRRSCPTPSGTPRPASGLPCRATTRGRGARAARGDSDDPESAGARELEQSARRGDPLRVGGRSPEERASPTSPAPAAGGVSRARTVQRRAAPRPPIDPNLQEHKNAFLGGKGGVSPADYLEVALQSPRSPYEIKAGTVLPAVLITAINSDLPGPVIAQVREHVYDTVTGNYLLVPQGSRLLAQYDSMVAWGQERVLVCWNRLIFPNGDSIDLECMPAADLAGRRGPRRRGRRALVAHPEGRRRRHAPLRGHRLRRRRHHLLQPDGRSGHGAERRGGNRPGGRPDHAHEPQHPADHHGPSGLLGQRHRHQGHGSPPYPDPPRALGLRHE